MLKFRYASYLLVVFALLAVFAGAIVIFLQKSNYLAVIVSFILIYPITFFIGKKMTKVFLLLSCLKYIKNSNGVVSLRDYENFVRRCARKGHAAANIDQYIEDIINTLESEKLIEKKGDSIILSAQ